MTESLSSLEELLSGTPRRYKVVTLPVSGRRVRIRSLTEKEMSEHTMAAMSRTGTPGSYNRSRLEDAGPRLICRCVVDGEGRPMLNDSHISAIRDKWDSADSGYLYDECSVHCGLNKKDIEDLIKNSEGTTVEG